MAFTEWAMQGVEFINCNCAWGCPCQFNRLPTHGDCRAWLDAAFSAGDLLMVTVLRRLSGSGELEKYPNLSAYVARGEARPAYKRAFADQLAVFTGNRPTG
jgi:hypothetical protein